MPFAGVGGTSIRGGYQIDNSLRFNDNDSPELNRTNVGSPTNDKIFTYSTWLKRSNIGSSNKAFFSSSSGSNRTEFLFRSGSNDAIRVLSTTDNFSTFAYLITTDALFRDTSAWYHIVIRFDSTDSTANDRLKIYANGNELSVTRTNTVSLNYQ